MHPGPGPQGTHCCTVIHRLLRLCVLPRHVVDRLTYNGLHAEIARRESMLQHIAQLACTVDWTSADGKYVLFHLLAVATWTSRSCRPDMPLSLAIAAIFESPVFELKNHHVRPLANSWANWGAAGVLNIFAAWNVAMSPLVTVASAASSPLRASRRSTAIVSALPRRTRQRRTQKRRSHRRAAVAPTVPPPQKPRRSLRLPGSRLPAKLVPYVVDLTS